MVLGGFSTTSRLLLCASLLRLVCLVLLGPSALLIMDSRVVLLVLPCGSPKASQVSFSLVLQARLLLRDPFAVLGEGLPILDWYALSRVGAMVRVLICDPSAILYGSLSPRLSKLVGANGTLRLPSRLSKFPVNSASKKLCYVRRGSRLQGLGFPANGVGANQILPPIRSVRSGVPRNFGVVVSDLALYASPRAVRVNSRLLRKRQVLFIHLLRGGTRRVWGFGLLIGSP